MHGVGAGVGAGVGGVGAEVGAGVGGAADTITRRYPPVPATLPGKQKSDIQFHAH